MLMGGNRYNGDTTTVICSSSCVSRDTNDCSMAPKRPIIIPHDNRGCPGICGRFHLSIVYKSDPNKIKCFRAGLFSVNQNFRRFYCFFFLPQTEPPRSLREYPGDCYFCNNCSFARGIERA